MPQSIFRSFAIAILSLFAMMATYAYALDDPTGDVILTVRGNVSEADKGAAVQFDAAMLDALPQTTLNVETPWYDERGSFSGPLLRDVLATSGAEGKVLLIKALNDYFSEVPASDAMQYDVILATRRNGEILSVRDKGPLFLVYPFADHPEIYNEAYFGRSVWQIKEIEVTD